MTCASLSAPDGRRASANAAGGCRTAPAVGIEAGALLWSAWVMTTETVAVASRPSGQIHAGRERVCRTGAMTTSLQLPWQEGVHYAGHALVVLQNTVSAQTKFPRRPWEPRRWRTSPKCAGQRPVPVGWRRVAS